MSTRATITRRRALGRRLRAKEGSPVAAPHLFLLSLRLQAEMPAYGSSSPASAALMRFARLPATRARMPSLAMVGR